MPQKKIEVTAAEVPTPRAPENGVLQELFEYFEPPAPPADAELDDNSPEVVTEPSLGPRERAVLDFEGRRFKNAGLKEQAVRDEFEISPTQYFQILNALLDDPEALAYSPALVARLRRLREARQRARR
ncbi:MAG TPA: DUF3263 domain-containing protein [Actinospica sp.]|nr:DUF3263 domain-containing protein [Actinospica sp.]